MVRCLSLHPVQILDMEYLKFSALVALWHNQSPLPNFALPLNEDHLTQKAGHNDMQNFQINQG